MCQNIPKRVRGNTSDHNNQGELDPNNPKKLGKITVNYIQKLELKNPFFSLKTCKTLI